MAKITGASVINNRALDGVTCYLLPASLFNPAPAVGDTVPAASALDSVVSGGQYGQSGGYRFDDVFAAEYYVGYSFGGSSAFDYHNVTDPSGAVVVNAPSGFVGDVQLLQQNSQSLFKIHTNPNIVPTSGNINVSVKSGIDEWFNLVNVHGQTPVSGMLTGMLNISVPDDSVFLNVQRTTHWPAIASTTPASGLVFPACGRLELRIGDEWGWYSQGFTQGYSAGFTGVHNYMVTDVNGASGGYSPFWIDHDGQVHCEALTGTPGVRAAEGDHGLLILNHSRGIMDTFSSVAIEMGVDNDGSGGGTPQPHGLIQLSYGSTVEGSENANWQFYHPQANLFSTGAIFQRAMELRFDGYLEIESHANRGGLLIQNEPYPSPTKGLVSLGSAGFGGLAGGFAGASAGTYLAVNASGSFTGNFVDLQQAGVSLFKLDNAGTVTVKNVDGSNSTTSTPLLVTHDLTAGGLGAAGIGVGIDYRTIDGGGAEHKIGTTDFFLADVTAGAFKSAHRVWVANAGVTVKALETRWNVNSEIFGSLYARAAASGTTKWGTVNIGAGGFGEFGNAGTGTTPFAGSAQGTLLALNATSAFTGDLINAQVSGGTKAKVDSAGNLTIAGALGVGNTVSKTTLASPGTVVAEMEVFNSAGVSLGCVPVYSKGSFS